MPVLARTAEAPPADVYASLFHSHSDILPPLRGRAAIEGIFCLVSNLNHGLRHLVGHALPAQLL